MGGTMKKLIILLGCSVALVNCQRAKNENTTVTFTLPALGAAKVDAQSGSVTVNYADAVPVFNTDSSNMNNWTGSTQMDAVSGSPLDADSWSMVNPTDYTGSTAANCFMLVATPIDPATGAQIGPNSCSKNGQALNFTQFDGPKWSSAASPATFSVTVASGYKYIFTLMASHVESEADCTDLHVGIVKSKISKPFRVGKTEATAITSSSSGVQAVSMSINSAFDADDNFDDCSINALGAAPEANAPAMIRIVKDEFPEGIFAQSLTAAPKCYPLHLFFLNSSGEPVVSGQSRPAVLRLVTTTDGVNCQSTPTDPECSDATFMLGSSLVPSFDSYANCSSGITSPIQFAATQSEMVRWVKSSSAVASIDNFEATFPGFSDAPITSVRAFPDTDPNAFFDIVGPKKVLKGQCAPYVVQPRMITGETTTNVTSRAITIGSTETHHPDTFFGAFNCPSPASTSQTVNFATSHQSMLYIRTDGPEDKQILTFAPTPNNSLRSAMMTVTTAEGGSNNPTRLKILTNRHFANVTGSPTCLGPFMVITENEDGAAVTTNKAITVTLSTNSVLASYAVFFQTDGEYGGAGCKLNANDTGISGSPQKIIIQKPSMGAVFYIQMKTNSELAYGSALLTKPDLVITATPDDATITPASSPLGLY